MVSSVGHIVCPPGQIVRASHERPPRGLPRNNRGKDSQIPTICLPPLHPRAKHRFVLNKNQHARECKKTHHRRGTQLGQHPQTIEGVLRVEGPVVVSIEELVASFHHVGRREDLGDRREELVESIALHRMDAGVQHGVMSHGDGGR